MLLCYTYIIHGPNKRTMSGSLSDTRASLRPPIVDMRPLLPNECVKSGFLKQIICMICFKASQLYSDTKTITLQEILTELWHFQPVGDRRMKV